MTIAVLSGKGGTGKTFVSVNLAVNSKNAVYLDCDVEEPDGHIFFKPEHSETEAVFKTFPVFNEEKCTACRKCVEFCAFNALAFIGKKPMLFQEVCHDCGGCELVCPEKAVSLKKLSTGSVSWGIHQTADKTSSTGTGKTIAVGGMLNIGEASGVPVIKAVLDKGTEILAQTEKPDIETDVPDSTSREKKENPITGNLIIDCPPGSSCAVMESIRNAEFCILVTEPTPFGLHNMNMVYRLVTLMGKKCGVIINKADSNTLIEDFCKKKKLPVLARIPFSREIARANGAGNILSETKPEYKMIFKNILGSLQEVLQ
jgi:MinD superfamily P-loop ATPase